MTADPLPTPDTAVDALLARARTLLRRAAAARLGAQPGQPEDLRAAGALAGEVRGLWAHRWARVAGEAGEALRGELVRLAALHHVGPWTGWAGKRGPAEALAWVLWRARAWPPGALGQALEQARQQRVPAGQRGDALGLPAAQLREGRPIGNHELLPGLTLLEDDARSLGQRGDAPGLEDLAGALAAGLAGGGVKGQAARDLRAWLLFRVGPELPGALQGAWRAAVLPQDPLPVLRRLAGEAAVGTTPTLRAALPGDLSPAARRELGELSAQARQALGLGGWPAPTHDPAADAHALLDWALGEPGTDTALAQLALDAPPGDDLSLALAAGELGRLQSHAPGARRLLHASGRGVWWTTQVRARLEALLTDPGARPGDLALALALARLAGRDPGSALLLLRALTAGLEERGAPLPALPAWDEPFTICGHRRYVPSPPDRVRQACAAAGLLALAHGAREAPRALGEEELLALTIARQDELSLGRVQRTLAPQALTLALGSSPEAAARELLARAQAEPVTEEDTGGQAGGGA